MITFHEIELADRPLFQNYFSEENSQQCDFNFGILYLWKNVWQYRYALIHDFLVIEIRDHENLYFFMPLGKGDLKAVLAELKDYSAEYGSELCLVCIEESQRERLEAAWPGVFTYEPSREDYDYICLAEKLSTYSGRALRGKKRPCNHFEKNYKNWHFEELRQEHIESCLSLMRLWMEQNPDKIDEDAAAEYENVKKGLLEMQELGLDGGVLYAENQIVAFTLGSLSRSDTFDTFFEKADITVDGAYAMVCREFTRYLTAKYPFLKYINREEDMGLDYLRKAKSMSDPAYMLVKYVAIMQEEDVQSMTDIAGV